MRGRGRGRDIPNLMMYVRRSMEKGKERQKKDLWFLMLTLFLFLFIIFEEVGCDFGLLDG